MQSTENGNEETQIQDMWLCISQYIDTSVQYSIEEWSLHYGMCAGLYIIETTLVQYITLRYEWNHHTGISLQIL